MMTTTPWIPPIERPHHLLVRIAYFLLRRRFGSVITPARVIYARYPRMLPWVQKMASITEKDLPLDEGLKLMIKYQTAWTNGCSFCVDIGERMARDTGLTVEKLRAVPAFKDDPQFTDGEKAALVYADAVNNRSASEAHIKQLRTWFDDRQIIGIAYIVATENYYNFMNLGLGIRSDALCSIAK